MLCEVICGEGSDVVLVRNIAVSYHHARIPFSGVKNFVSDVVSTIERFDDDYNSIAMLEHQRVR